MFLGVAVTFFDFLSAYLVKASLLQISKVSSSSANQIKLEVVGRFLILLLLAKLITRILYGQFRFNFIMLVMRLSNGINSLIFAKILKKSLTRDTTFSMGDITNYTQDDNYKVSNLANYGYKLLILPSEILAGLIWIYILVGWAVIPSLMLMVGIIYLNFYISKYYKQFKRNTMSAKDARGKLIAETFSNIRFIKISGLEEFFIYRIVRAKIEELKWIRKDFLRLSISITLNNGGPLLFIMVLFSVIFWRDGHTDIPTIFTLLEIFNLIKSNFSDFPYMIMFILDLAVSSRRISFILESEEISKEHIREQPSTECSIAIKISKGNFYWEDKQLSRKYRRDKEKNTGSPNLKSSARNQDNNSLEDSLLSVDVEDRDISLILKDIEFEVAKGSCIAIIGEIGAGKSTLLSAILGDTYSHPESKIDVIGEIAYVPQTPWIESKSLRENISFSNTVDEQRLKEVIKCCCLDKDVEELPDKEYSILGDKGVNLSGGQRMRVSIARALYSQRDIYLFDDPLSALDVQVGAEVLENGIFKYLAGKTRVVITHSLTHLERYEAVYILSSGMLSLYNPLSKAIPNRDGCEDPIPLKESDIIELELPSPKLVQDNRLSEQANASSIVKKEEKNEGGISSRLVLLWARLSGGLLWAIPVIIFGIAAAGGKFGVEWFLQFWGKRKGGDMNDGYQFVGIFTVINLIVIVATFLRTDVIYSGSIRLSKKLNFSMTFSLIHASVNEFFDRVPLGRILNRFLKDSSIVDTGLGWSSGYLLNQILETIVTLIVTCYTSSFWVGILIIVYLVVSWRIQRYYMALLREIERLKGISASPITQCLAETMRGSSVIRSFNKENEALTNFFKYMDENLKNKMLNLAGRIWFSLRIVILSLMVSIPSLIFAVIKIIKLVIIL